MRLPISLVINSNLVPISHRLANSHNTSVTRERETIDASPCHRADR